MNSTIWSTLSIFVQYLGRTNKCRIDKTAKGWYLEYIDPEREKRREEEAQKKVPTILVRAHCSGALARGGDRRSVAILFYLPGVVSIKKAMLPPVRVQVVDAENDEEI